MENYCFMVLDSLQKVFFNRRPDELSREERQFYAFCGERISFQVAYSMEYGVEQPGGREVEWEIESELAAYIRVRSVEAVPACLPGYPGQMEEDDLFHEACLCPDVLLPVRNALIRPLPGQWKALWFSVDITQEWGGRSYPVLIRMKKDGHAIWEDTVSIHVLREMLPQQKLIHTEWFHADCLADYYRVPVWSQEHWRIIENYVETAAGHGVNMLLTPVFTPPLDTRQGGERTTIQLVRVSKEGKRYRFDFSLLSRWIRMCRAKGIRYLEISHLFTQWGAEHAPKIMAWEDGRERRIFGWDTRADGEDYCAFLRQFLPELKALLKEEGILEQTVFHISDEPDYEHKASYKAARNAVHDLLDGCTVMDALSSFELYKEGIVEHPVVSSDKIQTFIAAGVKELWTYYCCAQGKRVSNRFMAIPPARNRILGVQLYLYKIRGFLHWGYNFYNAQFSDYPINPYLVTDSGGAFPAGDPFVVYPAADGTAYDSLRLEVFTEALYDMRALERLEEITDRDYVVTLIQEGLDEAITFRSYPKEAGYIRSLRRKIYHTVSQYGSGKVQKQLPDRRWG